MTMITDLWIALLAAVAMAVGALASYAHFPVTTKCVLLALGMLAIAAKVVASRLEKKRISELPPPVVSSRAEREERLSRIAARVKAAHA
ncbi:hypothetical protein [Paracoccus sp. ME4]|uniref:hypothetical protein n=1 Tax=Paracoccus sp. ME4 TaxID=3138066 RepID=UPI00398B3872